MPWHGRSDRNCHVRCRQFSAKFGTKVAERQTQMIWGVTCARSLAVVLVWSVIRASGLHHFGRKCAAASRMLAQRITWVQNTFAIC